MRSRPRRKFIPAKAWSGSFEYAFQLRLRTGQTKVTMSDKSNVQRYAGDLWQRCFVEVAARYPAMQANHVYVDTLAMLMVRNPKQFEVIVTNNMFGDIVTDLAAALQGGLGMAASGNINPDGISMFEPVHGSAPSFAGKNMANPMGSILTTVMMLEHLGFDEAARRGGNCGGCLRERRSDDCGYWRAVGNAGSRRCHAGTNLARAHKGLSSSRWSAMRTLQVLV